MSRSEANSSTITQAFLGNNVQLTGNSLNVSAIGVDDNFADTVAGSAGLIAGNSAHADTNNNSSTTAEIRSGSLANLATSGSGSFNITAEHTAKFNSRVQTYAGGLLAGTGAGIDNLMDGDVKAGVGSNATVLAKNIVVEAINHVAKPFLDTPNIDGTTGGLISGGGADSDTVMSLNTQVVIGGNATMTLSGNSATPGQFILRTLNDIVAQDKVAFTAGGALAGLSANTSVRTAEDLSKVQIGAGVDLYSIGNINISARGQGDVRAAVEAEAYGVGTYTAALAEAIVTPDNIVEILGMVRIPTARPRTPSFVPVATSTSRPVATRTSIATSTRSMAAATRLPAARFRSTMSIPPATC